MKRFAFLYFETYLVAHLGKQPMSLHYSEYTRSFLIWLSFWVVFGDILQFRTARAATLLAQKAAESEQTPNRYSAFEPKTLLACFS